MRTNLNKTNLTLRKTLSLPTLRAVLMVLLIAFGMGNAWAGDTKYYYAKLTISQSGPTGAGSVYVANSSTKPGTANPGTAVKSAATTSSGGNVTMYWWVDINPGYNVSLSGKVSGGPYSAASASGSVSCAASTSANGTQAHTATATFVAVTVNGVDAASKDLAPTNPSIDYPFTVTFATSNLKTIALDLNKSPETADGKFTITSWAKDGNNVIATGKFNGGGSYGGASRNNSTTVSLQSKASGSAAKTCTVTANFPALAFVGVEATDVYATQGESGKTGSATFTYNYGAEDDFPTDPTLTPVSGSGIFSVTGYTVTPDFSKGETTVTVDYSFDTNNGVGDTESTLTLTAANGDARSVTIAGHSEAMATDDAKVIAADGETLIYQGDWATAWTKANTAANAGCTLQVLRNVTGGSLNANQTVTNTFTLDLNGKVLTAKYNGSIIYVNKAGKTITIKDSKTGGKIQNINNEYAGAAYLANVTAGNLILESGTLYCENRGASGRRAVGVYNVAGTTVTMNGGKIEVHGYNNSQGVLQTSNKNDNTSFTMNAGEIIVDGYQDIYGISAPGKVNINDGTIDVTATYTNCRGITLSASASTTAANCYYGTLTMKGGTINSTCTADADGARQAFGIFFDCSNAAMGTATATDGSHANKAAAVGSIENATINVSTLGRYAYGVIAYGSYQSKTNKYDVIEIKNTKIDATAKYYYAYGIQAVGGVNGTHGAIYFARMELTDCEVNATTTTKSTAYAVYASSGATTVFKNAQPNYYGEYAGGATLTINSGTYTATTGTTTAYAACTSTRSITVYDPETNVVAERKPGSNVEGFATLIIHGGTFKATTSGTNTTARAVSSGGITTIDGGEFEAYAGGTTAYGLYAVSGKLTASGVKVTASATATAYGAIADCGIPGGNAVQTGVAYAGELVLNNCDITATTRTGTEARGVFVNATNKLHNLAQFKADSTSYTSTWAADKSNYGPIYRRVFPCTVQGRDSIGIAIAGKATINGGEIKATAATTTAYGVYAIGSQDLMLDSIAIPELTVKNAKITVATNGTTTANGIYTQGNTLVDGCDITVTPKTTTGYGIQAIAANDAKVTVKNTKITVNATTTAYGLYGQVDINTKNGQDRHGNFVLEEGNDVTANATSGATSYAVFLNATKRAITTPATLPTDWSAYRLGNYANAATAVINGGKYTATATGTTAYGIGMTAQQVQGPAIARPECTVIGGKFWGKAAGGTDGAVDGNGQMGYFVLYDGFYNVETNLSKYAIEGKNVISTPEGSAERTAGYNYTISDGISGEIVCKVYRKQNNNYNLDQSYTTLEQALQYVNANTSNTYAIVMVANYTLKEGNYVLPQNASLVVPESKDRKQPQGNKPEREATSTPVPVQAFMLTFDAGVNMTVYGGIETTAKQNAGNGGAAVAGAPHGNYGRLHLVSGSKITLESGSTLNCWGYCTGKGEIEAMSGSSVREGFQLGYWRGGTATSSMLNNRNSWHAFPVTDYFIQNIEAPILFRPGSDLYGYSAVNVSIVGVQSANDVHLLGSSGALFLMDNADASADTWVKKAYDPATDRAIWAVNSGAKLGQFSFSLAGNTVNSQDYYLPISNNMTIYINEGEFTVTQDALLIPGAQIIISKLGKLTVSPGKRLFVMDNEDWPGFLKSGTTTVSRYYYNAIYSPSWTTNPRTTMYPPTTTPLPDGEIFVEGETEGQYYTTTHGANIHSTNADAGKVKFIANAGGNTSIQHVVNTDNERVTINFTTAQLKNEKEGAPYTSSVGTVAGEAFVYLEEEWVKVTDGCLTTRTDGSGTHEYAKPSDVVEVVANGDNAYRDVATGTRYFINAIKPLTGDNSDECVWWEATPVTVEGKLYYVANQEKYDNYGTHFYWDAQAGYWKPKYVTVTWKNQDGTTAATYASVPYNTSPKYTSASPKVPATTSTYKYAWTGWDGPDGFHGKDEVLPVALGDIIYTAHIESSKWEYPITFKNSDNSSLETVLWAAEEIPSYSGGTPSQVSSSQYDYTFTGWKDATNHSYGIDDPLPAVSAAATYTAQYTATTRQYTITFLNYDMSLLGTAQVDYNATPSIATYKSAIAPSDFEPYKPDNSAYSFEFSGWRLNGASSNGFAQVKGDQTYIAQFNQTTKKYRISFVDEDGETVLHWTQLEYDAMPSYDGPATSSFDKQDDEWDYVFTGWTPATFSQVKGSQTYTANYSKTHRFYTITWIDGDGNALTTTNVEYGTTPTYPGTPAPTKTATNTIIYTFNNTWSPALKPVTGEATYTAQFNESERTYALTIGVNDAEFGSVSPTPVTGIPYNAAITVNGNSITVNGTTVTATPTAATAQYTYTFSSWSNVPGNVTADVSNIQAVFTRTVNTYNVTFNANGHGTAPSAITNVEYNSTISAPAAPSETGWTFGGWYKEEGCTNAWNFGTDKVTGATTLYAKWTQNKYNFTISVASESAGYGSVSPASVTEIPHGALVTTDENTFTVNGTTVIATPSSATERYIYEFYDWENLPETATEDVSTIQAVFTRTERQYTITWKNFDDETIKIDYLEYGETPSFDEDPTYGPTISTIYTFNGWDNEIVAVTGDATYTATYTESPRQYLVRWVDYDGHQLATTNRSYGYDAPPASANPTIPSRPSENGKVYTFSGWSDPVSEVEECDVTYTALYRVDLLAEESSGPVEIDTDIEVETTTVRVSGHLSIAPRAKLTTTDLVIEASKGASGEITGNIEDVTATNVYFDYAVESDGRHWNVFGVPFEIGDLDAVKLQYKNARESSWTSMTLGRDYDITYYDEATRAAQGPVHDCWKYVEDQPAGQRTLQPGIAYSIAFLHHIDTLRFTKAEGKPVAYTSDVEMENTNTGDGSNGGWNGIANPKTYHALLTTGVEIVQIHDGAEIGQDGYDALPIADYKFVVGNAGYVQVTEQHSVLEVATAGNQEPIHAHIAARRTTADEASELYTVEFNAEGLKTDRVYVRVEEGKSDEYIVGSDVMKMSVSSVRPQIWVARYDMKLCKSTTAPVNGQATYPLGLYAPAAGDYTIALKPTDEDEVIYLTCDGMVMWNLTYSPYIVQLEKGTNTRYGLQIVHTEAPAVTTGVVDTQAGTQPTAQKVLLNDKVYILRGTNVYTVEGQMVK